MFLEKARLKRECRRAIFSRFMEKANHWRLLASLSALLFPSVALGIYAILTLV